MLNRRHFCRASVIAGGAFALAGGPLAHAAALLRAGQPLTEVASLTELTTLVTELLEQADNEEWNDESRLVCR